MVYCLTIILFFLGGCYGLHQRTWQQQLFRQSTETGSPRTVFADPADAPESEPSENCTKYFSFLLTNRVLSCIMVKRLTENRKDLFYETCHPNVPAFAHHPADMQSLHRLFR